MQDHADALARFIDAARPLTVLTGAGVSTASGIPEYRDRSGNWKHARPVQFGDFVARHSVRRRYWAGSFTGWGRIERAEPNAAHRSLAALEAAGRIDTLITQNVDGLHQRAGQRRVIDLHGRLDSVSCLSCGTTVDRTDWQARLLNSNPAWHARISTVRPDGDVVLEGDDYRDFRVPDCDACGGIMKPDVVFFGESVPYQRVESAKAAVARSAALLIVGSSLMVFSGLRFARLAVETDKPVAIVNQGRTRADDIAQVKLDGDCGELLHMALVRLSADAPPSGLAM